MEKQHHGQAIGIIVRKLGFTTHDIAALTKANRRVVLGWFDKHQLAHETITKIAKAINHDLFTDLERPPCEATLMNGSVSKLTKQVESLKEEVSYWKTKYEETDHVY